jgi:hypothetical protein
MMATEVFMIGLQRTAGLLGVVALAAGAQGCEQVLGLDKFYDAVCEPRTTQPCYAGPDGTEGVGICRGGTQTCKDEGQGWGACVGAVLPAAVEDCGNTLDDDCNGQVNETCACTAGTTMPCYSGDAQTAGKGICHAGLQTCNDQGTGYGACVGEQGPKTEDCSTDVDDNCDGEVNEASAGCACVPGKLHACYSGPMGTEGVGICAAGTQTCSADGLTLGPCMGEVKPQAEDCSDALDNDCDGFACSRTIWAHQYGNGNVGFSAIAVDKTTGEIFLGGGFTGTIQIGSDTLTSAGQGDALIVKLGPDGSPVWAKRYGTASTNEGAARLALDGTGNVFIASDGGDLGGGTNIMKLDAGGVPLWGIACGMGTVVPTVADIAVTSTGDLLAVGAVLGTITCAGKSVTSAGGGDVLYAQISGATGAGTSVQGFGTATGAEVAKTVGTDALGNIYLGGTYNNAFGIFGASLPGHGGYDVFVIKEDPNEQQYGTVLSLGDAMNQTLDSMAVGPAGGVVVSGTFMGTFKFGLSTSAPQLTNGGANGYNGFIGKVDAIGNGVWAANTQHITQMALTLDAADDVLVAGTLQGTGTFGGATLTTVLPSTRDLVVAKLDGQTGAVLWERQFGDAQDQYPTCIAAGKHGETIVSGSFQGSLALDTAMLSVAAGMQSTFITEIAP